MIKYMGERDRINLCNNNSLIYFYTDAKNFNTIYIELIFAKGKGLWFQSISCAKMNEKKIYYMY